MVTRFYNQTHQASGMKFFISILSLVFGFLTQAQTIEIVNQSDNELAIESEIFEFIAPSTNIESLEFVATIKITGEGKKARIEKLFNSAMKKANELGANGFRLRSFDENDKPRAAILILDVFHGADSIMELNFENYEKNVVYIFTGDKISDENHTFKINKNKTFLKAGNFIRHEIPKWQEVRINIGGFTGATMFMKWKENKPVYFLTLTGFGLSGGNLQYGSIGLTFNTGRINYLNRNFGYLLTQVMSEKQ